MTYPYFKGRLLFLLTFSLGLGTFIQVLDSSIANVAIPHIAGDLGVSPNQGTWVITSFAISNAIVLPLTGWLSNYFGRVRLFVFSVLLFTLASLLCGMATNIAMLVFFRTLQGAFAGSLIPLSQSLLLINYPQDKQGMALGIWSSIVVVAPILGPIVGGYITDNYGWPWIFFINIPIGLLSASISWNILRKRDNKAIHTPIDFVGLILLALGVGALQIVLDQGNDLDWTNSSEIISLAILSGIALIYFIIWNYYSKHPVVDFSFFKERNFILVTMITSMGYLIFFSSAVLLPLWLQMQMGYDAFSAGLVLAPVGLLPIFIAPLLGRNLWRFDLRVVSTFSFAMFAFTLHWFSQFNTLVGYWELVVPRVIQGLAVSTFFIPLTQLGLAGIPHYKLASGSGLFNFFRIMIGSGFGTAIVVTFWTRRATLHHSRLVEEISFPLDKDQTSVYLNTLIDNQAYTIATNEIFWLCSLLFLVMIPLIWLCKPEKAVLNE